MQSRTLPLLWFVSLGALAAAAVTVTALGDSTSDDPLAIFRAPLLREGSTIIDARARIHRDEDRGLWLLRLSDARQSTDNNRELVLLPCTRLTEMQRIVETSPDRQTDFQISGRVFVYRGRNFVLPTHAPVIVDMDSNRSPNVSEPEADESPESDTVSDNRAEQPSAGDDRSSPSPSPTPNERDSAAEIMRQLEAAAGPRVRSSAPASRASTDPQGHELGRAAATPPPRSEDLLPEETSIVNRRGKLTRDVAGGWMFIFDADANGLSDPPLRLLPCLLLERIEDYARRTGNHSPALLSGTVYLYDGQNYLLPTVFRIPQERRNITP